MFISQRHRRRLRRLYIIALGAFVMNLIFPTNTHAAEYTLPKFTVSPVRPMATVSPAAAPVGLPTVAEKPQPAVTKRWIVRASAYTSSRWETDSDPFTTASGAKVRDGVIASNGLPFGTKIRIPAYYGDKVFTVADRMNARWGGRRIDIWMADRHQALDWGVRTVTIEILS